MGINCAHYNMNINMKTRKIKVKVGNPFPRMSQFFLFTPKQNLKT